MGAEGNKYSYDEEGNLLKKTTTEGEWNYHWNMNERKYNLNDRPKTIVDEFGLLAKDREEPVENLITWIFDEGTFRPAAKIVDDKTYVLSTAGFGTKIHHCTIGNTLFPKGQVASPPRLKPSGSLTKKDYISNFSSSKIYLSC